MTTVFAFHTYVHTTLPRSFLEVLSAYDAHPVGMPASGAVGAPCPDLYPEREEIGDFEEPVPCSESG